MCVHVYRSVEFAHLLSFRFSDAQNNICNNTDHCEDKNELNADDDNSTGISSPTPTSTNSDSPSPSPGLMNHSKVSIFHPFYGTSLFWLRMRIASCAYIFRKKKMIEKGIDLATM